MYLSKLLFVLLLLFSFSSTSFGQCPVLQSSTAADEGCVGNTVTLTTTVDIGVENVDYFLQWFEDGVAIPGASSLGADGQINTADDISVLTYNHTLPAGNACGVSDREFHIELYCLVSSKLEVGVENDPTNTLPCVVDIYDTTPSVISLDLSALPPCSELLGFDYGFTAASGGDFGASWICEALLTVTTPTLTEGPFCDAFYAGVCPTCDSGNTCFGGPTGAGVNTIGGSFMYPFAPGGGTGIPAQGMYTAQICDSFDDSDPDGEGCVNYVLLDVLYYISPGCSNNLTADSRLVANNTTAAPMATSPNNGGTADPGGANAGALSGLRICDAPIVGVDYTLPAAGCTEFGLTDVCGDLSIGYSATAGGPYDHTLADGSTLVTPATNEVIFYEIFIDSNGDGATDCPACATITGSFTLMGCPVPCDADAGTLTGDVMFLCNASDDASSIVKVLSIMSNNDYETNPADPCGQGGTPGVNFIVYSALPTAGIEDPCNDPAYLDAVLGSIPANGPVVLPQGLNYDGPCAGPGWGGLGQTPTQTDPNLGYNTTFFICPQYVFDEGDPFMPENDYDCSAGVETCSDVNENGCIQVVAFEPMVITSAIACEADPYTSKVTFSVTGGYPAYIAASGGDPLAAGNMFTLAETMGNGTLSTTTTISGANVTLSGIAMGAYEIEITDPYGCVKTLAGFWNQPTMTFAQCEDKVCTTLPDNTCAQNPVILPACFTGAITPQLGAITIDFIGDDFTGGDGSGFNIRNSANNVVFSSVGLDGVFTTPALDPFDSYSIEFVDAFGDGFSCTNPGDITVTDAGDGAVLATFPAGFWVVPGGCGANGFNTFGPFALTCNAAAPTGFCLIPSVPPIGTISGPGITQLMDVADIDGDGDVTELINEADFNATTAGVGTHTINFDFVDVQGCVLHSELTMEVCAPPSMATLAQTCYNSCTTVAPPTLTAIDGGGATTADVFEWYNSSAVDADGQPTGTLLFTGATFDPTISDPLYPGDAAEYCTKYSVFAKGPVSAGNPLSGDVACYSCPTEADYYRCVAGNPSWSAPILPTCAGSQLGLETLTDDPVDASSVWSIVSIDGLAAPVTAPYAGSPSPSAFTAAAGGGMVTVTLSAGANPGEVTFVGSGDGDWADCVIVAIEHFKDTPCVGCNTNADCDLTCSAGEIRFIELCPLPEVEWTAGPICCDAGIVFLGGADPGGLIDLTAIGGTYPVFQAGKWTGQGVSLVDPDATPFSGDEYYQFNPVGLDGDYSVTYFGGEVPCFEQHVQDFEVSCQPLLSNVSDIAVCPGGSIEDIVIYTDLGDANVQITTTGIAAAGGVDLTNAASASAIIQAFTATATEGTYPITVTAAQTNTNGCSQAIMFNIVVDDANGLTFTNCPVFDAMKANDAGNCTAVVNFDAPTALDNCTAQGSITVAQTAGAASGSAFPVGTTTITYSADDGNGNTAMCSFDIIVMDEENPTITCPASMVVNTDAGVCTWTSSGLAPTAADNCPSPTVAYTISGATTATGATDASTTVLNIGTSHILYTVTDASNNIAHCQFAVEVVDNQAPMLMGTAPAAMTVECGDNIPAVVAPTFTDNCTAFNIGFSEVVTDQDGGNCFTLTRTWIATDAAGNASTAVTQVITINDTMAPTAVPANPADDTVMCGDAVPAIPTIVWSDNCTDEVNVDFSEVTTTTNGTNCQTITRTWVATDGCGNATTIDQVITISDTTVPTITVTPTTVALDCADAVTAPPTPTVMDNCGEVTVDFSEVTTADNGTNCQVITRTWIATDACGNTASAQQVVTISDTTAPTITVTPTTLALDCADALTSPPIPTVMDNCGALEVTVDFSEVLSDDDGANCQVLTRTWVATDACGNTSSAQQVVTISDTTAPTISVTPATITLDCSDDLTAFPAPTVNDNCDASEVTVDFSEVLTDDDGANCKVLTRTWVATDACGNTSSAQQVVTINDTTGPVANPLNPADATVACGDLIPAVPAVTWTDNCNDVVNVDFSEVTTTDDNANQQVLTRTWVATDGCGNTTTVDQVIMINDTEAPIVTAATVPADVAIQCGDDIPVPVAPTFTDNCGDEFTVDFSEVTKDQDGGNCFALTRVWVATDLAGNVSTPVVQIVTIEDTMAPTAVPANPADETVDCGDLMPAVPTIVWSDNCADEITVDFSEVTTTDDNANQQVLTRTWVASDGCGNMTTVNQVITINDTTAPVLTAGTAPADGTFECGDNIPVPAPPTFTDNCGDEFTVEFSEVVTDQDGGNCFVLTRTWTATDLAGNIGTPVVQVITINDTMAPTAVPADPADATVTCGDLIPAVPTIVWSDNCNDEVNVDFSEVITTDDNANQQVLTRTWVASDGCGNMTTVNQVITIDDTTAPVLTAGTAPADGTFECGDDIPALAPPTFTDNCGDEFTVEFSEVVTDQDGGNCFVLTRTWTATDLAGNIGTPVVQVITINDTMAPTAVPADPADATVTCGDLIPAVPTIVWSDNCNDEVNVDFSEVITTDDNANQQVLTRTWVASDGCGNMTTVNQVITIDDTTAPVLTAGTAPADGTFECGDDIPALAPPTFTDNCGDEFTVEFSEVVTDQDGGNCFVLTRTWTATDLAGNIGTPVVQVITINDTMAPTAVPADPADATVTCGDLIPAVPTIVWSDNCNDEVNVDFSEVITTDDNANQQVLTRTWVASDGCGNMTTVNQVITIDDTTAPVLTAGTAPADGTFECGDDIPALAPPTFTDNCGDEFTVEFSEVVTDQDGGNCFVLTRTWTATDLAGNIGTPVVQVITINDTMAPTAVPADPADATVTCGDLIPAVPTIVWSDNCNDEVNVDFSEVITTDDNANQQVLTRTWVASDGCGNMTTVNQVITIDDTTAPVLTAGTAPADGTFECGDDIPALAPPTFTDNCGDEFTVEFSEVVTDQDGGNCFVLTRTWTATDLAGNIGTPVVQVITINDTMAPTAVPADPADATVTCGDLIPAVPTIVWSDNCNDEVNVDFSEVITTDDNANQQVLTRTWVASDGCGNMTTVNQVITIDDTTAPVLTAGTAPADGTFECGDDIPALAPPTFTDNCGDEFTVEFSEVVTDQDGGNCFVLTRTWTATDLAGNIGTPVVQVITINDTMAPTAVPADPADATVTCGDLIPTVPTIVWSDNCNDEVNVDFSEVITTDDNANQQVLTRTWVASDGCGNMTTVNQVITIDDTTAPVPSIANPADVIITCGDMIPAVPTITWTDNCGNEIFVDFSEVTIQNGPGTGDFEIVRTWVATDLAGNQTTIDQVITVNDGIMPTITCPANVVLSADVNCELLLLDYTDNGNATATDNCDDDVAITQSLAPGSVLNLGTTTITLTATDDAENMMACTFTITVEDDTPPVAVCQDITIVLDVNGDATILEDAVNNSSFDNCTVITDLQTDINDFACANVGNNVVVLTVTDGNSNTSTCQANVLVEDNTAPTFTCPAAQTVVSCNGVMPDLVALVTDAADACGIASTVQTPVAGTDPGDLNTNLITAVVTVTDNNGNTTSCDVEVTVDDSTVPVFVNCPTTMVMVANDVDECSGKVNWSVPVAMDDCFEITVTQTAGPASGTVVPVGAAQTITYTATDSDDNTSTCSFEVMVIDSQDPTYDADIVMPANAIVECSDIPAAFVLTNIDVNDNCTAAADLIIAFTEVSTQGADNTVCGPDGFYNYTITRTWTITDEAGNVTTHIQILTVVDTTAPIAICQDVTIVLDTEGMSSITTADVDNGSNDNCAPASVLDFVLDDTEFDCNDLGENTVTLTVTDPCLNAATCTAIITVEENPIVSCTPDYDADGSDPCACKNNATNLTNGQFDEFIQVIATANDTWNITSITGLFDASSAAPPAAPTPLANTTLVNGLIDGLDNDGDGAIDNAEEEIYYTLSGIHVDALGYTLEVESANFGTTFVFSNTCHYPTVEFANIPSEVCLGTSLELGLTEAFGGTGITQFFVNGTPLTGNVFDGTDWGLGTHTITATFDAEAPLAFTTFTTDDGVTTFDNAQTLAEAQADPGCISEISTTIDIVSTPSQIACNDLINVSLSADCEDEITPDMALEGGYGCFEDYIVTLYEGLGVPLSPANIVDASHIGQTLTFNLSHPISGNVCWGQVLVEDKLAPTIECPAAVTISCTTDVDNLALTGAPIVEDCSAFTVDYYDAVTENGPCAEPFTLEILRTFVAVDAFGFADSCQQTILVERPDLADIIFPADIVFSCGQVGQNPNLILGTSYTLGALPNHPDYPTIMDATNVTGTALASTGSGEPSINGLPIQGAGSCMLAVLESDEIYDVCGASYEILRTWKVRDMCAPIGPNNPREMIQIIKVLDETGPVITTGGNITVSANEDGISGIACTASFTIPAASISDACSDVVSIETIHPFGTNEENGGFIEGLAIGTYTFTYVAEDACGNTSTQSFTITVVDDLPPTPVCDEITDVALGAGGIAVVNAATLDDGSFDNCCLDGFLAARMDADSNGDGAPEDNDFAETVSFDCSDLGTTPIVVLRVSDCYGNFNQCMIEIQLEDNLAPMKISDVADQNITCDNYNNNLAGALDIAMTAGETDPEILNTLYGAPVYADNCGVTVTHSFVADVNTCGEGTITRGWTAIDAAGNAGFDCTQVINVNHVNDWEIQFPADVDLVCTEGMNPDESDNFGSPEVFSDDCELIAISVESETFDVLPDVCYQIIRTYTAINWCTYEGVNNDDDIDLGGNRFRDTDDGIVVYAQVIRVSDDISPVITCPTIPVYELDENCVAEVNLPELTDIEDCSPTIDVIASSTLGTGFGPFNNIVAGVYTVTYTATDNCGNSTTCATSFNVVDNKAPTPYCIGSLIIELTPIDTDGDGTDDDGTAETWATDFDAGSFDNCTAQTDLTFLLSLTSDINDADANGGLSLTCANAGGQAIYLFVTDEAGNTDVCQTNLFVESIENVCPDTPGSEDPIIAGVLATENGVPLATATVSLNSGTSTNSDTDGTYALTAETGTDVTVTPEHDVYDNSSVTTFDLVLIRQHILTTTLLDSPYKMIAADVNGNGSITALDMVIARQKILGMTDSYPTNTAWVFVDAAHEFSADWTLTDGYPSVVNFNDIITNETADFVAVCVGDVNGTYGFTDEADERNSLIINANDATLKKGEEVTIEFSAANAVLGYQFTLDFEDLEIVSINGEASNFGVFENAITTSFETKTSDRLFSVTFRATADVKVSEAIALTSNITKAEAYSTEGTMSIALEFTNTNAIDFALYQNTPNPVKDITTISFDLPEAGAATITVSDITGKIVSVTNGEYAKAYNEVILTDLPVGVLTYTLTNADFSATKTMVVVK